MMHVLCVCASASVGAKGTPIAVLLVVHNRIHTHAPRTWPVTPEPHCISFHGWLVDASVPCQGLVPPVPFVHACCCFSLAVLCSPLACCFSLQVACTSGSLVVSDALMQQLKLRVCLRACPACVCVWWWWWLTGRVCLCCLLRAAQAYTRCFGGAAPTVLRGIGQLVANTPIVPPRLFEC